MGAERFSHAQSAGAQAEIRRRRDLPSSLSNCRTATLVVTDHQSQPHMEIVDMQPKFGEDFPCVSGRRRWAYRTLMEAEISPRPFLNDILTMCLSAAS